VAQGWGKAGGSSACPAAPPSWFCREGVDGPTGDDPNTQKSFASFLQKRRLYLYFRLMRRKRYFFSFQVPGTKLLAMFGTVQFVSSL
jgi:predicted component of type VI protein secretion system